MGKTAKWMHYDRLGNLMNKSGTTAFGTDTYYQDAYGNVLSSVYTGAWASNPSGRHLTTKEIDGDVPLYYFWQRWYEPGTGRFVSRAPFPPDMEHPYTFGNNNSVKYIDPKGELSIAGALPWIPVLPLIDGPLPIGDIIAALICLAAADILADCVAQWIADVEWCNENTTGKDWIACKARAKDNLMKCVAGTERQPRMP